MPPNDPDGEPENQTQIDSPLPPASDHDHEWTFIESWPWESDPTRETVYYECAHEGCTAKLWRADRRQETLDAF